MLPPQQIIAKSEVFETKNILVVFLKLHLTSNMYKQHTRNKILLIFAVVFHFISFAAC